MGRLSWSSKGAWRGGALGLGGFLLLIIQPAVADERRSTMEFWGGAEVNANSWSTYSGATIALSGFLETDGWRLRIGDGYGTYSYESDGSTIRGHVGFGELLLGYQHQLGSLTLKGFVGAAAEAHTLSPFDTETTVVGTDYGVKTALESWWEITPEVWTSLDLSWSSVHGGTYAAHARAGYRIKPELSLDGGHRKGNAEYDGGRLRRSFASLVGGEIAQVQDSIDRSGETGYGALCATAISIEQIGTAPGKNVVYVICGR